MTVSPLANFDERKADPLFDAYLRGAWCEIDLDAVAQNYRQLRAMLPASVTILPCLKRNGYGCGVGPMAAALAAEGANGFAVASALDAVEIRRAGVRGTILLYPGILPTVRHIVDALRLTVTISSVHELLQWRNGKPLDVFIKADLGFFRAGATPRRVIALLKEAALYPDINVVGLYAHMSELPTDGRSSAGDQYRKMRAILRAAEIAGVRPKTVMMSSTEGVLSHPEMDFDAVDPGALFIGLPETVRPKRNIQLRPALTSITATLVSLKRVDKSLGPLPAVPGFYENMLLGVIGFGWGDGFPRDVPPQAQALIHGKRVPILPLAHLEHLRIDLTDVPGAQLGDRVLLLGKDGTENLTVEEVAAAWNTDVIGLYANLRDHIPRVYAPVK